VHDDGREDSSSFELQRIEVELEVELDRVRPRWRVRVRVRVRWALAASKHATPRSTARGTPQDKRAPRLFYPRGARCQRTRPWQRATPRFVDRIRRNPSTNPTMAACPPPVRGQIRQRTGGGLAVVRDFVDSSRQASAPCPAQRRSDRLSALERQFVHPLHARAAFPNHRSPLPGAVSSRRSPLGRTGYALRSPLWPTNALSSTPTNGAATAPTRAARDTVAVASVCTTISPARSWPRAASTRQRRRPGIDRSASSSRSTAAGGEFPGRTAAPPT
jgi:hypothetical protein